MVSATELTRAKPLEWGCGGTSAAALRYLNDEMAAHLVDQHQTERRDRLVDLTAQKLKLSVRGLLTELSVTYGMGWSQIAEAVGVTVSAVTKWRKGETSSGTTRHRLAKLVALLECLSVYVDEPAGWMEAPLIDEPGYFIRPVDIYLEGGLIELLELADQRITAAQMLDGIRPGWRATRSQFEVFLDTDGERSIRLRQDQN